MLRVLNFRKGTDEQVYFFYLFEPLKSFLNPTYTELRRCSHVFQVSSLPSFQGCLSKELRLRFNPCPNGQSNDNPTQRRYLSVSLYWLLVKLLIPIPGNAIQQTGREDLSWIPNFNGIPISWNLRGNHLMGRFSGHFEDIPLLYFPTEYRSSHIKDDYWIINVCCRKRGWSYSISKLLDCIVLLVVIGMKVIVTMTTSPFISNHDSPPPVTTSAIQRALDSIHTSTPAVTPLHILIQYLSEVVSIVPLATAW